MTKAVEVQNIVRDYCRTKTRLILLDFDGTLVPFDLDHKLTTPGKGVLSLLYSLAADTRNSVILISGRDKEYLEAHFNAIPITLVAEHGGYYKNPGGYWNTIFVSSMEWVPRAFTALHALSFQYEGSFVEQKTFSLAWHYRLLADKVTESDKRQILAALRTLPEHEQFIIVDSELTIELRTPAIDKGSFVARWVGGRYFDFIMAIGDSQTDEDIFKILRTDSYTIKVGKSLSSSANFYLESQKGVLPFINTLLDGEKNDERKYIQ